MQNKVTLCWVQGYAVVEGNERADDLTREFTH